MRKRDHDIAARVCFKHSRHLSGDRGRVLKHKPRNHPRIGGSNRFRRRYPEHADLQPFHFIDVISVKQQLAVFFEIRRQNREPHHFRQFQKPVNAKVKIMVAGNHPAVGYRVHKIDHCFTRRQVRHGLSVQRVARIEDKHIFTLCFEFLPYPRDIRIGSHPAVAVVDMDHRKRLAHLLFRENGNRKQRRHNNGGQHNCDKSSEHFTSSLFF
jgi:hypothetical protein